MDAEEKASKKDEMPKNANTRRNSRYQFVWTTMHGKFISNIQK